MMRLALGVVSILSEFTISREHVSFAALTGTQSSSAVTTPGGRVDTTADDVPGLETIEIAIKDGHYTSVEPILRQYLQAHPSSWRAHYDLGYLLFRVRGGKLSLADSIKESIKELSRSLELNTGNPDAHKILALDLVMIQREHLAEAELKEAERLAPGSAEIHYLLGRHYMGQSNYLPAKDQLEAAIRLDRDYMKAYENLGITMDMLGDGPAALTYYSKAIDLDEKQGLPSELPYLDLAKFYHDHNEIELAESFAFKALQRNPRSDQSYFELAKNYRERSEWKKAAEALEKAVAINPFEPQYYFLLGRTYNRLGELQQSQKAFQNYLKYRELPVAAADSSKSQ